MNEAAYQVMPSLSDDDYASLKADILARGVQVPVEMDEGGNVLDGHHRVRICGELGIDFPRVIREGWSDDEKRVHARQLNIARRHLNREQKQALIADQVRETPEASDRQIAAGLGVHHSTVGVVREELVATGEISQLEKTVGKDGKSRSKPRRTVYVDNSEAGVLGAKARAAAIRADDTAAKHAANDDLLASVAAVVPDGTFGTIVIDPPWPMQKIDRDVRPNQVAFDYPTMSEDELLGFGSKIAGCAADDCHMFMWTTQKFLPMALRVVEAWGFRYVLTMVWHKPGGFQPIGLPQYNCEFALYARRGSPEFVDTKAFNCCFEAPRREHSRKPDEFYDLVRRVTAQGRIDVFSREPREGFAQFGNEAEKFEGVA